MNGCKPDPCLIPFAHRLAALDRISLSRRAAVHAQEIRILLTNHMPPLRHEQAEVF